MNDANTIDVLAAELEAGRVADAAELVRSLRRVNAGAAVDRGELRGLMGRLGRSPADLADDAGAVRALNECAEAARVLPTLLERERSERDERRTIEARQADEREALRARHALELERVVERQRRERPAVSGDVRTLAAKLPVAQTKLAGRLGVDRDALVAALTLESEATHDEC